MASRATAGSGSACQERTSQPSGTAPRGPVAAHERPPPGHADVRQVGDVGRGVERPHRDAVRGRPGQRLDPGPGRRGVVEPLRLAQHDVDGRDPGRPVRRGPVDEREHLRLVDAVDAVGPLDLRGVHAPPPRTRPAAYAGPAGGRRPRLGEGAVGGVYAGTGSPVRVEMRATAAGRSASGAGRSSRPPRSPTSSGSGDLAGPAVTDPSAIANLLPWHGQTITSVGHRLDLAPLVRAGRRERLELARGRLGDDHVLVGEHGAAADRDAGRRGQRRAAARRGGGCGRRGGRGGRGRAAGAARAPSRSTRRRPSAAPPRRRRRHRRRRRACSDGAPAASDGWVGCHRGHQLPRVVGAFADRHGSHAGMVSPASLGESCGPGPCPVDHGRWPRDPDGSGKAQVVSRTGCTRDATTQPGL